MARKPWMHYIDPAVTYLPAEFLDEIFDCNYMGFIYAEGNVVFLNFIDNGVN